MIHIDKLQNNILTKYDPKYNNLINVYILLVKLKNIENFIY